MLLTLTKLEQQQADMRRRKLYAAAEKKAYTEPTMETNYKARRVAEAVARKEKGLGPFDPAAYEGLSASERMGVLTRYAAWIVVPIGLSELRRRRRAFDSTKNVKFPLCKGAPLPCWVCRIHDAKHRHHVVLLRNGGGVSSKSNIVLLCEGCHTQIHPWMHETKVIPVSAATFDLQRAKVESSDVLERAAKGKYPTVEGAESDLLAILHSVFNKLQTDRLT